MQYAHCQSQRVVKNGNYRFTENRVIQHHPCRGCGKHFSANPGTPMAYLRTPPDIVALPLKMRDEGMGHRASGRILTKSHSTIMTREALNAAHEKA